MTARWIFPQTRYALRGATILACIFFPIPFLGEYPFLFALKFGTVTFGLAFAGFFALFHSYFIMVSPDSLIFFQCFLPLGIFKKSEIESIKMLPFAKLQIAKKDGTKREFAVRLFDEKAVTELIRTFWQK